MKHIFMCILMLGISVISCKEKQQDNHTNSETYEKLKLPEWLIGNWTNDMDGVRVTEIWEKGEGVLLGKSYSIRNNDTISSERIQLIQEGDHMWYIPVVKNQNEGEIVKFKLTSLTTNQLVFENPEHDFPQKIHYTLINNDSLLAEISGVIQGKEQSEKFPMRRDK